jgi:hypothetical protein
MEGRHAGGGGGGGRPLLDTWERRRQRTDHVRLLLREYDLEDHAASLSAAGVRRVQDFRLLEAEDLPAGQLSKFDAAQLVVLRSQIRTFYDFLEPYRLQELLGDFVAIGVGQPEALCNLTPRDCWKLLPLQVAEQLERSGLLGRREAAPGGVWSLPAAFTPHAQAGSELAVAAARPQPHEPPQQEEAAGYRTGGMHTASLPATPPAAGQAHGLDGGASAAEPAPEAAPAAKKTSPASAGHNQKKPQRRQHHGATEEPAARDRDRGSGGQMQVTLQGGKWCMLSYQVSPLRSRF